MGRRCTDSTNGFRSFQSFVEWCHSEIGYKSKNKDGTYWALDKDILGGDSRNYSPQNCCFIPIELNSLFKRTRETKPQDLPVGIYKSKGRYVVSLSRGITQQSHLKSYFADLQDAKRYLKVHKEAYMKAVAEHYKGVVSNRVYEVLCSYEVSVDD